MKLNELRAGKSAVVRSVGGEGALRQHLLDMGLIPGAELTFIKRAPMGDPIEIRIHGYELTLRMNDAAQIEIEEIISPEAGSIASANELKRPREQEHPGLGETGRFHDKTDEHPLPEEEVLTFALVGNQNTGKTTLFNALTGSNQHVGNFPGVTVERKDGVIRNHPNTRITDLPGIYSMSPYSNEEMVSREFVLREKPKAIINIVDATNIERNLYLTMQLLEMDIPMVVALNMMDELTGNGGVIHINEMEQLLGVPVVPISASKKQGIQELIDHAVHVAQYQEKPLRQDFCDVNDHDGALHRCLHAVIHLIEDHAARAGIPPRFAASKLIEGDEIILSQLNLDENEKDLLEHILLQLERERGLDRSASIADMRFAFIESVCAEAVIKPAESKEQRRSEKLDRILTGRYTAIPSFVVIMVLVFWLTFNVIGAWLQKLLDAGITALTTSLDGFLTAVGMNPAIHGLIIDGIFTGVGSVLSFIPIIVTLFFFLSILEDSGYIARVAFFMDKLLRRIGLSGRSIVPMLIGFGCTVPAVMATRTLPSERDRRMTILLTPFMSCSAKLPIYAFFINAFFPGRGGLIMAALYLGGIAIGILIALIYKNTLFRGEAVPFVMELPNYRLPGAGNVARLLWEKARDFLQRAFTVIMLATIVIWFLQSFDPHLNMTTNSQDSILAIIAGWLAPLLHPVGLGDWKICTALITGFIAKESVVSTMGILYGGAVAASMTSLQAASMLTFSLIYTPCVAAIASVRRELGNKWAAGIVIWQCVVAWLAALVVFLIGTTLL